ncbi:MAG: inositol monophosphatase [Acidobacteria bacterium]|nr:inositol monophosphatase [Acidobacteriota bacterium]
MPKKTTYEHELETSLEIVRNAGALALQFFSRPTPMEEKSDSSPVTIADRECEKLICQSLLERFPEDGILGEEGAIVPSRSGRRWLIDPIDGTRDFVRRNSFWSVQLALQIQERVVLGIIYCPCMNEFLHAVDGQGCFWNGTKVAASDVSSLEKSILMVSGFKVAWESWPAEAVRRLTQDCWTVRCYGGCYDVILLARGKTDIWLSGRGMEWDYAPVQVIARECGARFLTKEGNDRIDTGHCLAFAPGLEREIREIMKIPEST